MEFVKFNPVRLWQRLADASRRWRRSNSSGGGGSGDNELAIREPTLFMAVPTIYAKMLEVVPQLPPDLDPSEVMRESPIRLMVSGSAALPTGIFNRWKELTGHTILERYGMSEVSLGILIVCVLFFRGGYN